MPRGAFSAARAARRTDPVACPPELVTQGGGVPSACGGVAREGLSRWPRVTRKMGCSIQRMAEGYSEDWLLYSERMHGRGLLERWAALSRLSGWPG